jgi:hypothetical protein
MRKEIRDQINRSSAEKSTGPKTAEGKQRSAMNAFKHGLTGQSLMLQPNEMEACNRLTASMLSDLKPKTEPERQLAQKIIDGHFRLNRLAAVENNMFNFGLIQHTTDTPHDDRVEARVDQTRAWIEQSHAFELVKYIEEFKRVQKDRIAAECAERLEREADPRGKRHENKRDRFDLASFGKTAPEMVISGSQVGTVSRASSFSVLTRHHPAAPQTPSGVAIS